MGRWIATIQDVSEFRPNVAALMMNEEGLLLVCERLGNPGAWQFPQGGVDAGENQDLAVMREIEEEIGLKPSHYEVEESRGGYRYHYPADVVQNAPPHKRHFVGQEQRYYLCEVKADAPEVNLMQEPREFAQAKWIEPKDFELEWLPDFKKETYQAVFRDFFGVTLGA